MTSPAWHYRDQLQNMGYGPEDIEEPAEPAPSEIVVYVMLPTVFRDYDTGELTTEVAPQSKAWPLFCAKAALRWKAVMERRHGKKNVWVEYQ